MAFKGLDQNQSSGIGQNRCHGGIVVEILFFLDFKKAGIQCVKPFPFVIPAKAGIVEALDGDCDQIPASAGMTTDCFVPALGFASVILRSSGRIAVKFRS